MSDLGKYWAGEPIVTANPLTNDAESGAFHRIDIAGVASSILATPTIKKPAFSVSWRAFFGDRLEDDWTIVHAAAVV